MAGREALEQQGPARLEPRGRHTVKIRTHFGQQVQIEQPDHIETFSWDPCAAVPHFRIYGHPPSCCHIQALLNADSRGIKRPHRPSRNRRMHGIPTFAVSRQQHPARLELGQLLGKKRIGGGAINGGLTPVSGVPHLAGGLHIGHAPKFEKSPPRLYAKLTCHASISRITSGMS